jgi:MFS family permease
MRRSTATFVALREPNFRSYFAGYTLSETGEWAQRVGQAWLVLELTGSGTLLGITTGLQLLPMLVLGPWAGLWADRADKRSLLIGTQSANGIFALVLAILTQTDTITVWMVMAVALLGGIAKAFDHPSRQGFILEMVGPTHLTNAVTLNAVVYNVAKILGPGLAGVLIAAVGIAASFYLNAASYVAMLLALVFMDRAQLRQPERQQRERGQIRGGFRHVRETPELLAPLLVLAVTGVVIYVWSVTLPIFARDAFQGGAETFGAMFSAMGIGAVIGGLWAAGALEATRRSFTAIGVALGFLTVLVATLPTLTTVLIALVLLGAASTTFRAFGITVVQLRADAAMRGRVMGILGVALLGTRPIGAPLVGWMSEIVGIRWVLGLAGLVTIGAALLGGTYMRRRSGDDAETSQLQAAPSARPASPPAGLRSRPQRSTEGPS